MILIRILFKMLVKNLGINKIYFLNMTMSVKKIAIETPISGFCHRNRTPSMKLLLNYINRLKKELPPEYL